MKRIVVVGTTGTGKTTMAQRLADRLRLPHVELDALHWGPNWTEAPREIFRARVTGALHGDAWVVDGNYGKVRDLVWSRADTVIWLDYPLWLILWRLASRTTRRVIARETLWNGNRETLRGAFVPAPASRAPAVTPRGYGVAVPPRCAAGRVTPERSPQPAAAAVPPAVTP